MSAFELHQQLAQDTVMVCQLTICQVLLMQDARFPWLILVPKKAGLRELHDLDSDDYHQVMDEVATVSKAMQTLTDAHKMNVASLGNQVPQLHIHIIARQPADPAWPGPVWGVGSSERYSDDEIDVLVATLREALS